MAQSRSLQQYLLELLSDDVCDNKQLSAISVEEWQNIIELATKQHVREYLYYHLKQNELLYLLPNGLKQQLSDSFKQKTFRNLALTAEFNRISHALSEHNIPVVALKGLHLIESVYPQIATRYFRDLDVLIPIKDAEIVYQCVQAMGYKSEKELVDFSFIFGKHLEQLINRDNKTVLELHGYIDNNFKDNSSLLWAYTHQSKYSDKTHLTFDLEYLLIHLCLHISYGNNFKIDLRHYLDIYVLLQKYNEQIDWLEVMSRVEKQKCTKAVSTVLLITSQLFNIKVPEFIFSDVENKESSKKTVEYALEFLWLYNKSSKNYEKYKSHIFILKESETSLVRKAIKRAFIPKKEIAHMYSLNSNSLKIYYYYIVRFLRLIKKYPTIILHKKFNKKEDSFQKKTQYVFDYLKLPQ